MYLDQNQSPTMIRERYMVLKRIKLIQVCQCWAGTKACTTCSSPGPGLQTAGTRAGLSKPVQVSYNWGWSKNMQEGVALQEQDWRAMYQTDELTQIEKELEKQQHTPSHDTSRSSSVGWLSAEEIPCLGVHVYKAVLTLWDTRFHQSNGCRCRKDVG